MTEAIDVATNVVGLDYFRTMGIDLVAGRDFAPTDDEESPLVVIANESFAGRYFPGENILGKRIQHDSEAREIVGLVRDSKYRRLGEEPTPHLYQPLSQRHETGMTLLVRTREPERLVSAVQEAIHQLEPHLPVAQVQPLAALVESSLFPARMGARLLLGAAILAGALAAMGLYGLVSFAVSLRTREMGIRVALGARTETLTRMVVGEGLRLVAIGLAIGSLLALAAGRVLASFLQGVSPSDPRIFLAAGALLAFVMLATAYVPARRAAAADPLTALRHD
jgi:predicted permease